MPKKLGPRTGRLENRYLISSTSQNPRISLETLVGAPILRHVDSRDQTANERLIPMPSPARSSRAATGAYRSPWFPPCRGRLGFAGAHLPFQVDRLRSASDGRIVVSMGVVDDGDLGSVDNCPTFSST
jgi:hypothetical protein